MMDGNKYKQKCEEATRFVLGKESLSRELGCAYCGYKDITLKACTRCRAVWYCGRECQMNHWRIGHKEDCYDEKTGRTKSWFVTKLQLGTVLISIHDNSLARGLK